MNTLMKYTQKYRAKTEVKLMFHHLLTRIKVIILYLEKL